MTVSPGVKNQEVVELMLAHCGALDQLDALRAALAPFAHDDLCEALGGNVEGDASIIFQRIRARITLGDCRRARALLKEASK